MYTYDNKNKGQITGAIYLNSSKTYEMVLIYMEFWALAVIEIYIALMKCS